MPIDYKQILGTLKDAVFGTVKEGAQEFLDEHQDARDFLEERAKRIAELGVEYLQAGSDSVRESVSERIEVATQSIRTQLAGIALDAEEASRAQFSAIVNAAVGAVIKMLPVILAAV
jgi:hypothetical protein